MRLYLTLFLLSIYSISLFAQVYDDYIGAGQSQGITTTSSDNQSDGLASVNGDGLDLDIRGSSRFLARSTMGFTIEDLQELTSMSYEEWVDNQLAMPGDNFTLPTVEIIFSLYDDCITNFDLEYCSENFITAPYMWRAAWWTQVMQGDDQLRQRVAMALSEILVLSDQSDLQSYPHGLAAYYDILYTNAFGNYRDILQEVTLNTSMGFYLSHLNNPRTIEVQNIKPDENYAREIMQLFSIGLYELNNDGTRKVDMSTGEWIPTYDNTHIQGLAKVFTGLSGSQWANDNNTSPVVFGRNFRQYSLLDPMIMYPNWHEPGPKTIIGDYTIPAGQTGMQDINEALDVLFNHDNVGPFLARRLIQRLVKSNPTSEYIDRVASAFNNNNGVRGDLSAMVRAIYLDQEAYDCYWLEDPKSGALRSPMLRYTQLLKGLKAEVGTERFYNNGLIFQGLTGQNILSAPSVFNFYNPDYVPNADFAYLDIVGPEYQILNSSTSSNYVNYMLLALLKDYLNNRFNLIGTGNELTNVLNGPGNNPFVPDDSDYEATLTDELWLSLGSAPEDLVDYLDILLTNGALAEDTKLRVATAMKKSELFTPEESVHYAAYLILIDPDFTVLK